MGQTFYTSDQHIGHKNIMKYEPGRLALGGTVDEMNEAMIDRWNSVVSPEDEVFVVGDWAMGKLDDSLALTQLFNGHKILICGNHDRPFHDGAQEARYLDAGFDRVLHGAVEVHEADRLGVTLPLTSMCHFPYESHDDRYEEDHPEDHGELLLHGHVHSAWKFKENQINVGCDVWDYYPKTLPELWAAYLDWLTAQLKEGLEPS